MQELCWDDFQPANPFYFVSSGAELKRKSLWAISRRNEEGKNGRGDSKGRKRGGEGEAETVGREGEEMEKSGASQSVNFPLKKTSMSQ